MRFAKIFLSFYLFTLIFFAQSSFTYAQASSSHDLAQVSLEKIHAKSCAHQSVKLNGNEPPIVSCLDNISKNMSPNIGLANCGQGSPNVTLWFDPSFFPGDTICFTGNGFANLTDYYPSFGRWLLCNCTWNDQASSFALYGCTLSGTAQSGNPDYPGYFAIDVNGGGQKQYFKWNVSKSMSDFTGQNGILPDNSLSSVYIDC